MGLQSLENTLIISGFAMFAATASRYSTMSIYHMRLLSWLFVVVQCTTLAMLSSAWRPLWYSSERSRRDVFLLGPVPLPR
jgi:hypothetical protein